ncbi:TIGR03118 family protein [Phenylobacterium sp.]|uniref:TIGR03118 family protein n=1 Tax=Phenylobacterium sp. TaxID=1871053 RepID=UPI00122A0F40|nr:TIGR03118 family protein [Phenylobacterium sp.]THD62875.1 MAG: TIGR03118 family protein [Phenylobacterium sp.]
MGIFAIARPWRTVLLAGAAVVAGAAVAGAATAGGYGQTDLVTDSQAALATMGYAPATYVDPNLVNPWGIDRSSTGEWWISNANTATETVYNGAGKPGSLVVTVPQNAPFGMGGGVTGMVYNGGSAFTLGTGGPARFITADIDGSISAWNGAQGTQAVVVVPGPTPGPPPPSVAYTGLAIGSVGANSYLYAANSGTRGGVDVYNTSFQLVSLGANAFSDPGAPQAGLAAFNAQNINGNIFVTYAVGGPPAANQPLGSGYVDEYDSAGNLIQRFTGADLDSPWGVALAPSDFGAFSNDILIGNFTHDKADGFISAYSQTGTFEGLLTNPDGTPITIDGLWGLEFGNGGTAGPANALYFAAGVNAEQDGLFGRIDAVPEPASWALMILGVGLTGAQLRRRTGRAVFAA